MYKFDFFKDTDTIMKSMEDMGVVYQSTCNGDFNGWYYKILMIAHIYFILDYLLRLASQKHIGKFFMETDSIVEIITTVPILLCFTFMTSEDYGLQFFVMIDCLRLFTYPRYIKHLESEIVREGL